ncbi:MAG: Gfo/Idh/MocA family oxidoreductase [Acidimicrobiales bacterium]|nr:Gfo/Idh/MocA family oxidoreductase [Acidimicrobiales bacterium]
MPTRDPAAGPAGGLPVTTLAFAGAGWVTTIHGLAAASLDGLRVGQVASRHEASARRRAQQCGAATCRYDDLPGDADAVVVATPPALHRREAERAVAGDAVALVETPLAATLADADAIVALADQGRVAYAENLAHSPAVAETVQACRKIGALTHLEVRFVQGRPEPGGLHLDGAWGGGALFDLGVHALAVAVLMAAPARVTSVQAELDAGADIAVDDDAGVTLTFDTGLHALVRASWRAAAPAWDAQAASATSAVRLELVPDPSVELNGSALRLRPPPAGLAVDQLHYLGYRDQLAALAADARHGRSPRVGAPFGRLLLDIVCAAYASARTGEPEPVPFTGPRGATPHQLWRGDWPIGR